GLGHWYRLSVVGDSAPLTFKTNAVEHTVAAVASLLVASRFGGRVGARGAACRLVWSRSRHRRAIGVPLQHRSGASAGACRALHPVGRRLATVQCQPM